jgi:hypothetical protein
MTMSREFLYLSTLYLLTLTSCTSSQPSPAATLVRGKGSEAIVDLYLENRSPSSFTIHDLSNGSIGILRMDFCDVELWPDGSRDLVLSNKRIQIVTATFHAKNLTFEKSTTSPEFSDVAAVAVNGILEIDTTIAELPGALATYMKNGVGDQVNVTQFAQYLASHQEIEFTGFTRSIGSFHGSFKLTDKSHRELSAAITHVPTVDEISTATTRD